MTTKPDPIGYITESAASALKRGREANGIDIVTRPLSIWKVALYTESPPAPAATTQASTAQAEPDGWIAPAYITGELTSVAFRDIETARATCGEGKPVAFYFAATSSTDAQAAAEVRDAVRDAVAEALNGIYYCGRVWEAWDVGTMCQDDFTPAAEVDDVLDEITDAAIRALRAGDTGEQADGGAHA